MYIHGHDGGEMRIEEEKEFSGDIKRKESTIQNCSLPANAFKRKRIKRRA